MGSYSLVSDWRSKSERPDDYVWAKQNGYIVFTHDLDFGVLLALTQAFGPSVIQLRADDVLPEALAPMIIAAIRKLQTELAQGALVTIDPIQSRVRILPFAPSA